MKEGVPLSKRPIFQSAKVLRATTASIAHFCIIPATALYIFSAVAVTFHAMGLRIQTRIKRRFGRAQTQCLGMRDCLKNAKKGIYPMQFHLLHGHPATSFNGVKFDNCIIKRKEQNDEYERTESKG